MRNSPLNNELENPSANVSINNDLQMYLRVSSTTIIFEPDAPFSQNRKILAIAVNVIVSEMWCTLRICKEIMNEICVMEKQDFTVTQY